MLQVQRALLRPRLRRSWLVMSLVISVVVVALVGALTMPPDAPRPKHTQIDRMALLEEEVRQLSLEACEARVELERIALRNACAAGTASKRACDDRAEGQIRFDPCRRYRPPELGCPFPGSCTR